MKTRFEHDRGFFYISDVRDVRYYEGTTTSYNFWVNVRLTNGHQEIGCHTEQQAKDCISSILELIKAIEASNNERQKNP